MNIKQDVEKLIETELMNLTRNATSRTERLKKARAVFDSLVRDIAVVLSAAPELVDATLAWPEATVEVGRHYSNKRHVEIIWRIRSDHSREVVTPVRLFGFLEERTNSLNPMKISDGEMESMDADKILKHVKDQFAQFVAMQRHRVRNELI